MRDHSVALHFGSAMIFLSLAAPASADGTPGKQVNCSGGQSLAAAVANAQPDTVFNIRGTCAGPVVIASDGVQLKASGAAGITGAGKDVVIISGAQRVTLDGLAISGGANGVFLQNGAQALLQNVTVSNNAVSGIVALGNSSVTVIGGSSQANAVHGLDIEATSSLIVIGSYSVSSNGVFGLNINTGSSLTLWSANLSVTQNTLGIQLGTNASGFLDGKSTLTASSNFSDGITIVSGSHVVDFGGVIQTSSNQIHGISLNSKAGLDLDAGSQVTSNSNGGDGVHLEQSSELTVFNNPNFSGNPTATLLTAQSNKGSGVNLLTSSHLLDDNYAAIVSSQNTGAGLAADDGSSVSFGKTISVDPSVKTSISDVRLSFGSRLTYIGNDAFGSVTCDATVLIRGTGGFNCPKP